MSAIIYKNYPILVVDDEENNLRSYLRALKDEFEAEGVSAGQEALEKLKQKEYAVVVSDQKMYPMTGVDLLSRVRELHPNIMRIVITGHSDFEAAINAINNAEAFRFIFKSVTVADDLTRAVKQAIDALWDRQERLRLQNLLMRENRMAALGKLAWVLGHEMNNPLTAISTLVQLLLKKHQDGEFKDLCTTIKEDIARIQKIVGSITKFSEAEKAERVELDLRDVIEEAFLLFYKSEEMKKMKLDKGAVQSHIVKANRYLLVQVLLNLLTNAAQGMKDAVEGKVEMITEKEPVLLKDREGKESPYIRLIVKDNGSGIKKEILENIFDPFVTTHDRGSENRRPGLGLFISQLIIEGHHGFIDIQSKVGEGTRVTIDLPLLS